MNYINDRRMLLDYQRDRLAHGLTGAMGRERERFARLAAALDALSPLKVLGRGYAIPQRSDGAVLRSAKEACRARRCACAWRMARFPVK